MSHPERRRSKGRALASALAAVMVLFSLAYTPSPKAAPQQQCAWYKRVVRYTDATLTTSCGVTVWFCDGEVGHSGCFSTHTTTQECECFESRRK